ncbi:MAG: hypothetical protein L0241_13155 [Planctomycetia bacterium]|nr:hypothetical protein [Planctomycetia bacterium]
MKARYPLGLLICGLIVLVGCGKKDETDSGSGGGSSDTTEYTLKVRTPGEGSQLRGSVKIEMSMSLVARDPNGKRLPGKEKTTKEEIGYSETIETFPDGAKKPTKSRAKIDKWVKDKNGGITKEEVMKRIVGRDIIIEKQFGTYNIHAQDGGPIDPEVYIFLDKRYQEAYEGFNIHDFLPDKPVKIGTTWPIPIERLVKAMGNAANFPFDAKKSTGSGKLLRVDDKDGKKYGRIKLEANIVPKISEKDVAITDMKVEMNWIIDLCIDGSRHDITAKATVEVSVKFSDPKEGTGKAEVKGTITISEIEEKIGKAANPPPRKKDTGKPTGKTGDDLPPDEFPKPDPDWGKQPVPAPGPGKKGGGPKTKGGPDFDGKYEPKK